MSLPASHGLTPHQVEVAHRLTLGLPPTWQHQIRELVRVNSRFDRPALVSQIIAPSFDLTSSNRSPAHPIEVSAPFLVTAVWAWAQLDDADSLSSIEVELKDGSDCILGSQYYRVALPALMRPHPYQLFPYVMRPGRERSLTLHSELTKPATVVVSFEGLLLRGVG